MSSPVPEDPYSALGVPTDADISTIRSAHRKLVLRLHPDRIKDEAEKAKGKDEFQKVQQAYELLSDPARRSRYDDKIKIAELRREAMLREPSFTRHATYPIRPAQQATPGGREYRDGTFYEERVPTGSYFETQERFEEAPQRASSRKYDEYERKSSTRSVEKEKKNSSSSKWGRSAGGIDINIALNLKKRADEARDRVREKTREREIQATKAKTKDREERRERSEKQGRRTFVVDDEGSDSDTATYVGSEATARPSNPSRPSPRREPERRRSPERSRSHRDGDDESYDDPWERKHASTREYIAASKASRPPALRSDSDAYKYWEGEDRGHSRRSGSDSDRRPTSSKGRRPDIEISKTRSTPSMPMHTSAPSNLRAHVEEREPMQRRSNTSTEGPREREQREQRREMPSMSRSKTMPTSRSAKKDTAPSKGSNLKHAETHDSGYGSSSPHTPEMPGISPTRESARQSSTRYQIVEPVEEEYDARNHRTILIDEEDRHRRFSTSPGRERDRRDRPERPSRPRVTTDTRSRSSRVPSGQGPPEMRPQMARHESSRYTQPQSPRGSPCDSPPVSRHNSSRGSQLFGEIPPEEREPSYYRKYPAESISMSPRIDPEKISQSSFRRKDSQDDVDSSPGSRYRQELRHPMSSRRGSVY